MIESRRIRAGSITFAAIEAGEGGRPLLLVHGFTGAKEDFADHLEALADAGWHAVAYDQRGHGATTPESPADEAAYSLESMAGDLLAVADALGWPRFTLLGHSMGGMVAQVATLQAAARLDGLVLMDTTHGPVEGIDPAMLQLGQEVVRQGGMALLVETQRGMGADPLATPAHLKLVAERPGYEEWGWSKAQACSPAMWASMAPQLLAQADRLDHLAALDLPVLVMVGEQDEKFVPDSERMAKTIGGARLAVIADAGHSPQMESPDAWLTELTAFLGSLPERG